LDEPSCVALLDQADDAQRARGARCRRRADDVAHVEAEPAGQFLADDNATLHALQIVEMPGAQLVGNGADADSSAGSMPITPSGSSRPPAAA
jgi:hypothetical protein